MLESGWNWRSLYLGKQARLRKTVLSSVRNLYLKSTRHEDKGDLLGKRKGTSKRRMKNEDLNMKCMVYVPENVTIKPIIL